jgi:hypothetical protein
MCKLILVYHVLILFHDGMLWCYTYWIDVVRVGQESVNPL